MKPNLTHTIPLSLMLAFTTFSPSVEAREVRKIFDGTSAYCPPADALVPVVPESAFRAEIIGQEIEVSLNVCDNGKWTLDQELPIVQYLAPNGEQVEMKFESFRLIVQTPDWSQTKAISLPNFASAATARILLSEIEFASVAATDISLMALRTTTTSSGNTFKEDVRWGALRISK